MKALCWFETEKVSPAQRSKRQRKQAAREQVPLRAINIRYACDILEAEKFGELLWATGCEVKADLCAEAVFLGDGAGWIWNQVSKYYPNALQIVDWCHAEEHLENLARCAFHDPEEQKQWLEQAPSRPPKHGLPGSVDAGTISAGAVILSPSDIF